MHNKVDEKMDIDFEYVNTYKEDINKIYYYIFLLKK